MLILLFIDNLSTFWSLWVILATSTDWLIQKIIGQFDIKHIVKLLIKTTTSVVKILTYIITGIAAQSMRLVTCCNTSCNVCLDLHNYRYSICN